LFGFSSEIGGFIGVLIQIKELSVPRTFHAIFDEFVVILLDRPLSGHEGKVEVFAVLDFRILENRVETFELYFFGNL